jgi:hypothetical protein
MMTLFFFATASWTKSKLSPYYCQSEVHHDRIICLPEPPPVTTSILSLRGKSPTVMIVKLVFSEVEGYWVLDFHYEIAT